MISLLCVWLLLSVPAALLAGRWLRKKERV